MMNKTLEFPFNIDEKIPEKYTKIIKKQTYNSTSYDTDATNECSNAKSIYAYKTGYKTKLCDKNYNKEYRLI